MPSQTALPAQLSAAINGEGETSHVNHTLVDEEKWDVT